MRTLLAAACALMLAPGPAAAQKSLEYAVKANYLVKFAAFVEWPPSAFAAAASPVIVCVVGRDPFGAVIDRAAAAHSVGGRSVAVRRLDRVDARSGCHIAYLGDPTAQTTAQTLQALAAAPVLTVTDSDHSRQRGMVHFALADSRVRFHMDAEAAQRARLSISSRLLSLALSVKGGRRS